MSLSNYTETFKEIDDVLEGVRGHLKKIIVVFVVGFIIGWPASNFIIRGIINKGLSLSDMEGVEIIQTQVLETFLLNTKIALIIGFFLTLPLLLYYGYRAADNRIDRLNLELDFSKTQIFLTVILSILLFLGGVIYAYYLMVPLTIQMLILWTKAFVSNQIQISFTIASFINFVLLLLLAFGITFELPIIVNLSIRSGLISYESLKTKRKHIYVVLLVLSGLITGPNIISQVMVAIPLALFFEIGLLSGKYMSGKKTEKGIE